MPSWSIIFIAEYISQAHFRCEFIGLASTMKKWHPFQSTVMAKMVFQTTPCSTESKSVAQKGLSLHSARRLKLLMTWMEHTALHPAHAVK